MNVVFFLNRLHPHVDRKEYEEWVRSVDYPTAQTLPSIIEYKVARIEGLLDTADSPPYEYIERVLIRDLDSYRRDLADPRLDGFKEAWASRVSDCVAVQGSIVE
jgi:REDY-like protein HapK